MKWRHYELIIITAIFLLNFWPSNKYIDSIGIVVMFYFIVRLRYILDKLGYTEKGEALA
jgi:hypothetical protein